jgi:hypothetical protein
VKEGKIPPPPPFPDFQGMPPPPGAIPFTIPLPPDFVPPEFSPPFMTFDMPLTDEPDDKPPPVV